MPAFTIELSYYLPVYQHSTIEAASVDEGCRLALERQDWENARHDYEGAGPTFVSEAWHGPTRLIGASDRGRCVWRVADWRHRSSGGRAEMARRL